MAAKISSIFSSRGVRGASFALAILLVLNLIVGLVPDLWIGESESSINQLYDLDRRVERYPHREAVQLLVLGNSHAQHGLRPEVLARHFGLNEYAVFSLALPASNPLETRLLFERYATRFPHARLAICEVNVAFLNQLQEARLRYLTRASIANRWRMAVAESALDDRLGLSLGLLVPLFDLKESLRKRIWIGRPKTTRMAVEDQARVMAAVNYPFGYPVAADQPVLFTPADRARLQGGKELLQRAAALTSSPERIPHHLEDLRALKATLTAYGLEMALTEMPVSRRQAAAFDIRARRVMANYHEQLAAFIVQERVSYVEAPALPADDYYYDGDHLTSEGSDRVAAALAAKAELRKLLAR